MSEYTLEFVKRLESLYHEQIRKTIDLEVRLSMFAKENETFKEQFELSQKEVEKQNEVMLQATTSIEALTLDKKSLEGRIEELNKTISQLSEEKNVIINEKNNIFNENNNRAIRIADLEKELQRRQEELQKTYDDLVDLRIKFDRNEKELNAKIILLESMSTPTKKQTKIKKESIPEDSTF